MLRTVILHGALAAEFGERFTLEIKSPAEALRALMLQLRGFRQALRNGHYRILKTKPNASECLGEDELRLRLGKAKELHVVPVLAGAGNNGWGKILMGVALIGIAIAAPYALGLAGGLSASFGAISAIGFSGISFSTVAGIGAAIALGGVAQLISPAPKQKGGSTSQDRMESFLFGSADNVAAQGGPVPLVFGEWITGSVVISVGLSTEELGTDPNVNNGIAALRPFAEALA